ncbi:MAG: DUF106 domain-containing protein [Crenarchaeota archaeon]|nr:DUF106 domain-containing protein [Thermoproteota archaeon]
MKINKQLFTTVLVLLVVCTLTVFASTANAQQNTTYDFSISSTNHGVNEASIYTLIITNTGDTNLVNVNITVPESYTNIADVAVTSQAWSVTYANGMISLVNQTSSGLANSKSVTITFKATNPVTAGTYDWSSNAVDVTGTVENVVSNHTLAITSLLPMFTIFAIAAVIAFANSGVNKVLVGYFVGWDQYRVMQKEMAEHHKETMAAARANDQKRMEKLKRKQSQINNMQAKMMKPQMIQIGISFVYIIVWFLVLIPVFGTTSIAYLPGIGSLPVIWLYPILSFFLGFLFQRILGINPIEM